MLGLTALELARIQFGFTVSFHIIFPAITIGLASYLAVLEGLWLWKQERVYRELYHFWSKVFAVNFAMGVVSGLVMAYQFGTNWSHFSAFAGGVTGPLLAYEVLTAFFLEAGFLGVMLFGWNKVGPALHFFATCMVALGTLISATWILASNSWMQTPQGFEIIDGRVVPTDWLSVIFNPSFPYRLVHMTLAAYLSTALFVGAAGAWHMLRGRGSPAVRRMFSMAMWMLVAVAPLQIIAGDQHGLNTLEHQPAKVAAMEGHWENHPGEGLPLVLFGLPDMATETTRYALEIPRLGSLILTHSLDGQIPGLKEFAPGPPQRRHRLLDLPHHGGARLPDARPRAVEPLAAPPGPALRHPAVPALRPADGARGADRGPRRLVHHRDRPPALGGLQRVAHGGRGLEPLGADHGGDARPPGGDVRDRLRGGGELSAEAHRPRHRRGGRRSRRRRLHPRPSGPAPVGRARRHQPARRGGLTWGSTCH